MGVSKVVYGNNTLIDLTADTVTASTLLAGETAHGADGEIITGEYYPPIEEKTPCAYGTFSLGTSRTTVEIGFKAKYLTVLVGDGPSAISTYNADLSTTKARYSGASTETTTYTMSSDSTNYRLHSVTDTGFTVNKRASGVTSKGYYYAIGYPVLVG